ncbi:MAG: transglycosylase SLT domain-containing protein [Novosphingobium sp.]|nr:transglycosylase SLT domain-containing protein [Novosphingobium sp.]
MSSMLRASAFVMLLAAAAASSPARSDDGREWDTARARQHASDDAVMRSAIQRWKVISKSSKLSFDSYVGFLLSYPGFPFEEKVRKYAESALERVSPDPKRLVAYFEKFPPLTNPARARYALALASQSYPGASETAIAAWRGGPMSETAESAIIFNYGDAITRADHDARMDALLWAGKARAAARQISYVSPQKRNLFMERLSLVQGSKPGSLGLNLSGEDLRDPGYAYNRIVQARRARYLAGAVNFLATRPPLSAPVLDGEKWVKELLTAAKGAGSSTAVRIAASIDDGFAPGTDISTMSFRLRDDYTSLMWLGGTKALWSLRDPRRAAPLFYRYGAAAKTPGTRSKGFYWAGRALAKAGDREGAKRHFEQAAQFPDHFYGMLSLERLGRPLPNLAVRPAVTPTTAERRAFMARPITRAVMQSARSENWLTTVRFFREIAEQAESEAEHVLVADLAKQIGRRDLAVILGRSAHTDGFGEFHQISFPRLPAPAGTNWVMVHAITRQESQFAMNAISHAGARGLMQLMPGTAREQAGKMGLSYRLSGLLTDANYNIRLGDGYFGRMMSYYGGAYPLAVGAYNAGPGNVNKWLRANGDPRKGGIDWVTWIERIPIYETKTYITKVLENAVVYQQMNPDKYFYSGDTPASHFLGKRDPG